MRFLERFVNHSVSTTAAVHADSDAIASESTSNATSTSGTQGPLVSGSGANRTIVSQSINPVPPNGQASSANPSSAADIALDTADKILAALQTVSKLVTLPLGIPQAATVASELLTMLGDKRENDAGVRELILDISKIILGIAKPIRANPGSTTEQDKHHVREVLSYLSTLQNFCEGYLKRNWFYRFLFSSTWKQKLEDIRKRVHMQLHFVSTTAIMEILAELNSFQKSNVATQATLLDNAFHEAEIGENAQVYNFVQHGLDQSLPIPDIRESSSAFERAKINNAVVCNHGRHYRQQLL